MPQPRARPHRDPDRPRSPRCSSPAARRIPATSATRSGETAAVAAAAATPPPSTAGGPAGTAPGERAAGAADSDRCGSRCRGGRRSACRRRPKPFADVIKDAKETPGLFHLWQKDDKVWIEIAPEQFDQPFFFTSNLNQRHRRAPALRRRDDLPGRCRPDRRVPQHRQHRAADRQERASTPAKAGTPEARAVAEGFSDSLLATAPVASPAATRAQVGADRRQCAAASPTSRRREPFPRAASTASPTRSTRATRRSASAGRAPDNVALEVSAHYSLSHAARCRRRRRAKSTLPPPPSTLPDVRSLFLGYYYNLAKLPDGRCAPRRADDRIGYFTTDVLDFTTDIPRVPVEHYVNRWRLEKKDPARRCPSRSSRSCSGSTATSRSSTAQPIRDGILEWNKAFEQHRLQGRDPRRGPAR